MENGELKIAERIDERLVTFVAYLFVGILFLATASWSSAAQSKPAWQLEWEKVVEAAKKEGQVAVYISGYEEILPEFQK